MILTSTRIRHMIQHVELFIFILALVVVLVSTWNGRWSQLSVLKHVCAGIPVTIVNYVSSHPILHDY